MEFVFVVPRENLFPDCYPHGFGRFGEGVSEESFYASIEAHGFFVERAYAECTPSLKQIIPYTVVARDGEVFLLRRTNGGGESRLHNKLSIGVGGHINPVDQGAQPSPEGRRGLVSAATRREVVEEELHTKGPYEVHSVGILNDDSNPVGAVHVGLVQVLSVEGPVSVREVDQLEGRFASVPELEGMLSEGANFETWSALLVPSLSQLVPNLASSPS